MNYIFTHLTSIPERYQVKSHLATRGGRIVPEMLHNKRTKIHGFNAYHETSARQVSIVLFIYYFILFIVPLGLFYYTLLVLFLIYFTCPHFIHAAQCSFSVIESAHTSIWI